MRTLFETVSARLAVQARVCEPLDTNTVTKLNRGVLGMGTYGHYNTNTLCGIKVMSFEKNKLLCAIRRTS
jgi:hypothetical protein